MAQTNIARLKCTETGHIQYWSTRNKKSCPNPLKLKKYNPKLKRHTLYKEAKK